MSAPSLPRVEQVLTPTRRIGPVPSPSAADTEAEDEAQAFVVGPAAPSAVGRFQIQDELGRGGMGVVYRAWDADRCRTVALKVMLHELERSVDAVARFQTEAEVGRRLRHPHIVEVYESGASDGLEYIAMQYIDGDTLEGRGPVDAAAVREAVACLVKVARAIHFAHTQGVLHRDLKPSNILVDAVGEPHVADFGLAKRVGLYPGRTVSGQLLGTPEYMAPEQASGHGRSVGPAADVYSLGAILYYLLTGKPPFSGRTPIQTIERVVRERPCPVRLVNKAIGRQLEAICLRCLEKDPADRYPSAAALADDLERFLDGRQPRAMDSDFLRRVAQALSADNLEDELSTWANVFWPLAAVVLVHQAAVGLATLVKPAHFAAWAVAIHASQVLMLFAAVWAFGPRRLAPSTVHGRQVLAIWAGYLAACTLAGVIVGPGWLPQGPADELRAYPLWCLLAGLTFLSMGMTHWGCCYLFGLGFVVLAVCLRFVPGPAPLAFGLWWAVCLGFTGWRLNGAAGRQDEIREGLIYLSDD